MPLSIDHVIIVVRDLAQASRDFATTGFTVTPGGEHTGGATHNALISFADGSYIELIAFAEPDQPQPHRWWRRLSRGGGLVDYALLSDDLQTETAAIRQRGLAVPDPVDGGRHRPDGQRIAWRSTMLQKEVGESPLPFLIEDVTSRDLRVPGPPATEHELGMSRIAGITLVTADLHRASGALGQILATDGVPASTNAATAQTAVRFSLDRQWLELIEPGSAADAADRLARFGEGPYEVVLAGDGEAGPGSGQLLEVASRYGARLRLAT